MPAVGQARHPRLWPAPRSCADHGGNLALTREGPHQAGLRSLCKSVQEAAVLGCQAETQSWSGPLGSPPTDTGQSPGARSAPPGTCAGQSEGASRASLLWAHPSCGPTMCQSPAGHEQCGRGPPPRPLGEDGSGLCSPGPEGMRPYASHRVASQSGFLEVPQEEQEGPRPPRLRRPVSLQGGCQQPPRGQEAHPPPHTLHSYPPPTQSTHITHMYTHIIDCPPHSHAHFAHAVCRHPHMHTYRCSRATDTHVQLYTKHVGHTQTHCTHTHEP